MEIEPTSLHERTPLYIGSADQVEIAERFLAGTAGAGLEAALEPLAAGV
jgi:hypothetical protein